MAYALLHFIKEDNTDIVEIESIPQESRFPESFCQVKWKNSDKPHAAKVLKIGDFEDCDKAEDLFHDELDMRNGRQKRKRKPNQKYGLKASDREVATAVHERPKLNQEQAAKKKAINRTKREAASVAMTAQSKLDAEVLGLKSTASTVQKTAEDIRQTLFSDNDEKIDDPTDDNNNNHINTVKNIDVSNSAETSDTSLEQLIKLKNLVTPSVLEFISVLSSFVGLGGSTENPNKDKAGNPSQNYIEVLPVKQGEVSVELTKGSGVFIGLRTKTLIKTSYPNNPQKMLHALLVELLSKEVFKVQHVTARGSAVGSRGIRPNVLQAMLSFINRNVTKEKQYSERAFIKAINRKTVAWREEMKITQKHTRMSSSELQSEDSASEAPKSVESSATPGSAEQFPQKAPPVHEPKTLSVQSVGMLSPWKVQPLSHDSIVEPSATPPNAAIATKVKSPWKVTPNNSGPTNDAPGTSSTQHQVPLGTYAPPTHDYGAPQSYSYPHHPNQYQHPPYNPFNYPPQPSQTQYPPFQYPHQSQFSGYPPSYQQSQPQPYPESYHNSQSLPPVTPVQGEHVNPSEPSHTIQLLS